MANPGTAAAFAKALRAEGLVVKELDGWATHNRNHKGSWGPLYGVMVHHTVSGTSGIEDVVYNGYAGLPGPLCQGLVHKDGSIVAVGWGRCNHAGGGDPDVLAAIKAETYPLPKPTEHDGSPGDVDGNAHFVGFEGVNKGDGKDPWPFIQLEAIARACAAVCRQHGWDADSVLRHMDWSDWKSDPKGIDWPKMRARINTILSGKPNATPLSEWADGKGPVTGTKPPSKPPVVKPPAALPVVSVAHIVAAYHHDRPARQGSTLHPAEVKLVEAALDKLNFLSPKYAKDGSFGTTTEAAYNAFRRSIGMRGLASTGVPGKQSLQQLGSKSGLFTVKN